MNISELVPPPQQSESFLRSRCKYVPAASGCYVLTTFSKVVLYVGLTNNLRRRMNEHLDSPEKTSETQYGRAILFHWTETADTDRVERTWMNIHQQHEGCLPILNKVYSPVSV
jgi:predicted GIY-YIG superfamily endonuclease